MHYIIDTSYLDVLFDVPGHGNHTAREQIKVRLGSYVEASGVLYVPVPVIFELCNHIAQVGDGGRRRTISMAFVGAVRSSLTGDGPWTITPSHGRDALDTWVAALEACVTTFEAEFVANEIGLTDVAIIMEARRLVAALDHYPHPRPKVHILTNDRSLKAHEPDSEEAPIVW